MMIVHIGYHKTGTTHLQQNIYPNLEGISFHDYATCHNIFYNKIDRVSTHYLEEDISNSLEQSPHSLYSFENLVGEIGTGLYNYEIAVRLKSLGFKKVIITIRNQYGLTESIYRQYVQSGGTAKPNIFFNPKYKMFSWDYADYYPLILHYEKLFGRKNLLIIKQEELLKSERKIVDQIVEFTNARRIEYVGNKRSNKSLNHVSLKILRWSNNYTFSRYNPSQLISEKISSWRMTIFFQKYVDPFLFAKVFKDKSILPSLFHSQIEEKFGASNYLLDQAFQLGLDKSGYPYQQA